MTSSEQSSISKRSFKQRTADPLLPKDHLEWVEAWGMSSKSMAHVFRPSTKEGVEQVYEIARKTGRTIALKGGGNSYGDPFQNSEGLVLNLSRMSRILDWNPETGIIKVEPGIRIADLWKYIVGDGYWPPVVSGTMMTEIGGCLGMNIHGKNAYRMGPIGNHVLAFDIMLPNGEVREVTRENNPELFYGAIGSFGMLGSFLSITMKMKKVHSGNIKVTPAPTRNFFDMIEQFEDNADKMDYMVGWADGFPKHPDKIGRGEMHFARYLQPGEDPMATQTSRLEKQDLPPNIMGIFPKSSLYQFMKFFINDPGMWMVNTAKYVAQHRPGANKPHYQSHAGFHFLLDYVPDWKLAYKPNGLIQYQTFVPKENAAQVFTDQIKMSHKAGIVPYLGVTKKHIPDDFLISHGVDGYSLALDFPVTPKNRRRLWSLCHEMDEMVLAAGGRFYLAKDCTMQPGTPARYLPEEKLETFLRLKKELDPDKILSSNMFRRIFPDI